MSGRNFVPLTQAQLMKKLHLPKGHKAIFTQVLETLLKRGVALYRDRRYIPVRQYKELVTGLIRMHKRGFGFVQTDDPGVFDQDIFIPKPYTQTAVDGDRVEVEINPKTFKEKGPEGRVVTILERGRTHLAGIVRNVTVERGFIAYAPILGDDRVVLVELTDETKLVVGDRIVMEVIEWGERKKETRCRLSHRIGHISEAAKDIDAAIEEYELRSKFPKKILRFVQNIPKRVAQEEIEQREDLRELVTVTIDPDTAKDFDDAISIEKTEQGHFILWVHIADVSHYVQPGTPLDQEARLRSNSTYFPGTCLPMLPPFLSENLCSLRPNVNRLTVSICMEFDPSGELISHRITRSVIKSIKRFTYKEAKAVLDRKKKSKYLPHLNLMVELCALLKAIRAKRGSVEFALPEVAVLLDKKGEPIGTDFIPYDITHQMIEEFMLKANEVVATHLDRQGKRLPYRVHEPPSPENMRDFVDLVNAFGFKLSHSYSPQELQEVLDEALETSYGHFLAISYIRRMRAALYSPENVGHYGLGLSHYCHFTSPIRRYVDLVIHRTLFGVEHAEAALAEIADECSGQERISEQAEKSVSLLKKLRLINSLAEKDPNLQFEAVVTKVHKFGIYFEIADLMVEGFLHLSELADDYYEYDPKKDQLVGKYGNQRYFTGEKLTVMLREIDLIVLKTKWHLVSKRKKHRRNKASTRVEQEVKTSS